jgi:IS30 family transposase
MGRTYEQLSLEERCSISRLRADGISIRQIAANLGRAPSSVSRELKRNTSRKTGYQARHADELNWARRWRGSRMARQPDLQKAVLDRLVMGWSPEQISGWLALNDTNLSISHESIYRFIYAQIARTKDYSWRRYLPRAKSKRGRYRRAGRHVQNIKHRVSIHERPACVDTRAQPGHWETDLILMSDKKSNILVAQERTTRYVRLIRQSRRKAEPVAARLCEWFRPLPPELRRSLTQDNGVEFSLHHRLQTSLGMITYFCDPHSPWQKGGIENMNGRIRRFIPLKTKLENLSDQNIQIIENLINHTPRKCLGFKTPAELFYNLLKPLHFKCESTFRPSPE